MLDALVAAAVVAALVAAGLAALYAVTVVPFLVTVGRAEQRGYAVGRWAAAALVAVAVALGLALVVLRAGRGPGWLVVPLPLAFAPAVLVRTAVGSRFGGRAGRHEPPL